jgi:hypothetical protein
VLKEARREQVRGSRSVFEEGVRIPMRIRLGIVVVCGEEEKGRIEGKC